MVRQVGWGEATSRHSTESEVQPDELQPWLLVCGGREVVEEEGAPRGKDAAVHADSSPPSPKDDLGISA
jgi:hypothetical protein